MTKIAIRNEDGLAKAMVFLGGVNLNHEWSFELKRHVKNRSLSQNALYWKWMTIAGQELGYSKDEMDVVFKRKFLAPKIVTVGDEETEIYSTSGMDKNAMTGYLNLIDMFCARDLGIMLPHPEEMHYRE